MNKRNLVFIVFLLFVSVFTIVNLPSFFESTNNSVITTEAETASTIKSEPTTTSSSELIRPDGCNYYSISTAGELDYLSQNINKYKNSEIVLTADIDLSVYPSWKPIGFNKENFFNGIFNGKGYKISGLRVAGYEYAGLFGYLGSGAEIKNLVIEDARVESSLYAGALAGYSTYYYGSAKLDNITVINPTIKVNSNMSAYVGGIIGFKQGGEISNCMIIKDNNTSVIECTVTQTTYTAHAGGIVGAFERGGKIDYCANSVNVITNCSYSSFCGGIVGYSSGELNVGKSYNTGNITAAENSNMKYYLNGVGGIIGKHVSGKIVDCFNSGKISSNAVYTQESTTNIKPEDTNWYTWENSDSNCIIDCLGYYGYLKNNSYISKNISIKNVGGIAGCSNGTISSSYNSGIVDKSEIKNNVVIRFSYSEDYDNNVFVHKSNVSSSSSSSNSSSSSSSSSSSNSSSSSSISPVPDMAVPDSNLTCNISYTECLQTDIVGSTSNNAEIVDCYCNSTTNTTEPIISFSGFDTRHTLVALKNHEDLELYVKYSYEREDNTITFYVESNEIWKNGSSSTGGYESSSDDRSDEYTYGWASNLPFAKYTVAQVSENNGGIKTGIKNIVKNGTAWAIHPDINNGNPYLKDFYWSPLNK